MSDNFVRARRDTLLSDHLELQQFVGRGLTDPGRTAMEAVVHLKLHFDAGRMYHCRVNTPVAIFLRKIDVVLAE